MQRRRLRLPLSAAPLLSTLASLRIASATFGQVGAAVQFKVLDIDLLGFVRGDLLFGNSITGAGLNIGLRKQF